MGLKSRLTVTKCTVLVTSSGRLISLTKQEPEQPGTIHYKN